MRDLQTRLLSNQGRHFLCLAGVLSLFLTNYAWAATVDGRWHAGTGDPTVLAG